MIIMTQKPSDNRTHKVKVDYGMYNYYLFFKRTSDIKVSQGDFGEIIKEYNNFIRDSISFKGESYKLPNQMGIIELSKYKAEVIIDEDGKLQNNLPVNWQETRKLWLEYPAEKEKGTKIKFVNTHSNGYTFKFTYIRTKAKYKHKTVYRLKFNRLMKRQLSKSIFSNSIDAFLKHY
jgi:hypothetical protein